jgi:hypothetical protein
MAQSVKQNCNIAKRSALAAAKLCMQHAEVRASHSSLCCCQIICASCLTRHNRTNSYLALYRARNQAISPNHPCACNAKSASARSSLTAVHHHHPLSNHCRAYALALSNMLRTLILHTSPSAIIVARATLPSSALPSRRTTTTAD